MSDMICFMAIDKEDDVTVYYSFECLRAGQEREKVVLKYRSKFSKYLKREALTMRTNRRSLSPEDVDLNLRDSEINVQAGTSGIAPDSLLDKNIHDHHQAQ